MRSDPHAQSDGKTKGSAGGATAFGHENTVWSDWSFAAGEQNSVNGYSSLALGTNLETATWGEVGLGMYSNRPTNAPDLHVTRVTPKWNAEDAVLRVGAGCSADTTGSSPEDNNAGCPWGKPGFNITGADCEHDDQGHLKTCYMDALRITKDGKMTLRKWDGSTVDDVVDAINALQQKVLDHKPKLLDRGRDRP